MNDKDLAKTAFMKAWEEKSTTLQFEGSASQKTGKKRFERWWQANYE